MQFLPAAMTAILNSMSWQLCVSAGKSWSCRIIPTKLDTTVSVAAPGPYILEFIDGELDTVYLSDGEASEVDYETMLEITDDLVIENLYSKIKENIDRNPHSFNVEYNHQFFFPKEAYFDFEENIADEELGYYIRDFSISDIE